MQRRMSKAVLLRLLQVYCCCNRPNCTSHSFLYMLCMWLTVYFNFFTWTHCTQNFWDETFQKYALRHDFSMQLANYRKCWQNCRRKIVSECVNVSACRVHLANTIWFMWSYRSISLQIKKFCPSSHTVPLINIVHQK